MEKSWEAVIGAHGLPGTLASPGQPSGLVVFAHGSGSSRFSPRNSHAAAVLRAAGFATLLFDLLTEEESADRRNVFDLQLLSSRVVEAIDWIAGDERVRELKLGLFGASTGAGAAIMAAAERPDSVSAIVSRGGRPDLAGEALGVVCAPTLLIVGGEDRDVLALNMRARRLMQRCVSEVVVVPGAGHLFEEYGALDQALAAATDWFARHMGRGGA